MCAINWVQFLYLKAKLACSFLVLKAQRELCSATTFRTGNLYVTYMKKSQNSQLVYKINIPVHKKILAGEIGQFWA